MGVTSKCILCPWCMYASANCNMGCYLKRGECHCSKVRVMAFIPFGFNKVQGWQTFLFTSAVLPSQCEEMTVVLS